MKKFVRLPKPDILALHEKAITNAYIERRTENARYEFQWPQIEGKRLNQHLIPTLGLQTDGHCSYCDGYPLKSDDFTIDHFKPKSLFYELVVEWTNLYLCCSTCQRKGGSFNEQLLRPDADDYVFEDYFMYDFNKQELRANPRKPAENQTRADETIRVFNLNHPGLIAAREDMWDLYQYNLTLPPEKRRELNRYGFRFMFF